MSCAKENAAVLKEDNTEYDDVPLKKKRNPGGRPKGSKTKVKSNYDPTTMTMPSSKNIPGVPLDIWSDTSVQEYFPYLYQEYIKLSNRMKAILVEANDSRFPVPKEGECVTKFINVDFAEMIPPFPEDAKSTIPFDNHSYINQFSVFMIKMFKACETGSISGDACVSIYIYFLSQFVEVLYLMPYILY